MVAFRGFRRWSTAVLVTLATGGGLVVPAPGAMAATTASCPTGIEGLSGTSLHLPSSCAGFPDSGAPYVFRIDTLLRLEWVGLDLLLVSVGRTTVTCAAYQIEADGSLDASSCTNSH